MKNYFLDRIEEKKKQQETKEAECLTNTRLEEILASYNAFGSRSALAKELRSLITATADYYWKKNHSFRMHGGKVREKIERECLEVCVEKANRFNGRCPAFNYFTTIALSHIKALWHAEKRR